MISQEHIEEILGYFADPSMAKVEVKPNTFPILKVNILGTEVPFLLQGSHRARFYYNLLYLRPPTNSPDEQRVIYAFLQTKNNYNTEDIELETLVSLCNTMDEVGWEGIFNELIDCYAVKLSVESDPVGYLLHASPVIRAYARRLL